MKKGEILVSLAETCDLSKKQVDGVINALVELSYKEAKNGFAIPGLGKLVLKDRKARMGRNPQTGESLKIPAKTVLKFRIAKQAKVAVLGAKASKKKVKGKEIKKTKKVVKKSKK